MSSNRLRVDESPDFRITRNTGVQSDLKKRIAFMNSQKNS